ncbi:MAG: LVIVD repeat-containing protein [Candidatus Dormibacteria bacterium]
MGAIRVGTSRSWLVALVLSGAAGVSSSLPPTVALAAPAAVGFQAIPHANCGAGSSPENGFQGEVPLVDRLSGRSQQGYRCNLELVGQWQGEGASWQNTWYDHCDYYDQNAPSSAPGAPSLQHPGSVVVDVADPTHPAAVAYLSTPAMLHPWESLKVNQKRGLLAGNLTGGLAFDIYDVSKDCTKPQLLASLPMKNNGHEGEWSPDGLTYWGSSTSDYHAIDVSDPTHPNQLQTWTTPGGGTHGLSISEDGTRAYFTSTGLGMAAVAGANQPYRNGLVIADVSDIQFRRPNPQIRVISETYWPDGSAAQHTIPITVGGKPYLVFVDELGSGGLGTNQAWAYSCANSMIPFGIARIFDISDEKNPKPVSRLTLETDDPANCAAVMDDENGQAIFAYDSHYCAVDQRQEATTLACGYFNSGIRVFDIRDPFHPREIAYFNPPARVSQQNSLPGSEHIGAKTADWCSSQVRFIQNPPGLWAQCQDNGFMTLRFTNGVWPLTGSGIAAATASAATAAPTPASALPNTARRAAFGDWKNAALVILLFGGAAVLRTLSTRRR